MRARIIWAVLALVVALIAWALLTSPTAPGRIGVNRLVENAVTTTPAGQTDWRPSVTGADVNFGDRVATAAASRLEVSLLDRSLLTVGANARLEIDRFVYDPERDIAGVAVSMLRGAFRFASDNRGAQPEAIAFRTPGAAIGIRGTIIEGVVGPEAVAFLRGIPGAPDLSAESDSAAVIILREGAIGVEVNGQSVVLDRPVQIVALTRTRLYPAFGASEETNRRFEVLLPTRSGPSGPPPAPPPVEPTPVPAPVDPVTPPPTDRPVPPRTPVTPPTRQPPAPEPPARDPPASVPAARDPAVRPAQIRPARTQPTGIRAPTPVVTAPPESPAPAASAAPAPTPAPARAEPGTPVPAPAPSADTPRANPVPEAVPPVIRERPARSPPASRSPSTAVPVSPRPIPVEPRVRPPLESRPQAAPAPRPGRR